MVISVEPTRDDEVRDSQFNIFVQNRPKAELRLSDILGSRDADEYLHSLLTSMEEAGFTLEEAIQSLLEAFTDLEREAIERNWPGEIR